MWTILYLFSLVVAFTIVYLIARFVLSKLFQAAWAHASIRWSLDTAVVMLGCLCLATLFYEPYVPTAKFGYLDTISQEHQRYNLLIDNLLELQKQKFFVDHFPLVVGIPSLVVALGAFSFERSKFQGYLRNFFESIW